VKGALLILGALVALVLLVVGGAEALPQGTVTVVLSPVAVMV
jgi:hypothetical protein